MFAHSGTGHPFTVLKSILLGAAAGAAGTTALNAVTFLDMIARGRPPSRTPEESVQHLTGTLGVEVPGDEEQRWNRISGAGALLGTATGVSVGCAHGLARSAGWQPSILTASIADTATAMSVTALSLFASGVSDPRRWTRSDWLSDFAPHLAYGLVTSLTYAAMTEGRSTSKRRGRQGRRDPRRWDRAALSAAVRLGTVTAPLPLRSIAIRSASAWRRGPR
ncbi:hypothetical protein [Nocardia beijingensis]